MTSWEDIAKQHLKICFLKNSRYRHSQYTYFLCNIPKVLLWFLSFKWPTSSKNWGQPFAKREETSKKTTKFLHFPSKTPKLAVLPPSPPHQCCVRYIIYVWEVPRYPRIGQSTLFLGGRGELRRRFMIKFGCLFYFAKGCPDFLQDKHKNKDRKFIVLPCFSYRIGYWWKPYDLFFLERQ